MILQPLVTLISQIKIPPEGKIGRNWQSEQDTHIDESQATQSTSGKYA